ncbi:MAG TPA: hypothetical protein VLL47_01430, partial [Robiginitalea sp.]|nr:hypothetical protein [Robiginitalea sp.]
MRLRLPAAALAILFCLLTNTACREAEPHPVEQIIGRFSDSLPRMTLPEDADPADENWAGIDLEPKA